MALQSKGVALGEAPNINAVMKKAFGAIGYSGGHLVTQISTAFATIGQQMGNLRNKIGTTAQGKFLEELKARNNTVDDLTKEFLIDTTVIVASFLIRTFENVNPRAKTEPGETKMIYTENELFNDFWDDLYGEFEMEDCAFPASEILFHVDYRTYRTELQAYNEGDE
jgi:hypothetical protein